VTFRLCFDGWFCTTIKTGNPHPFKGAVSDQVGTNTDQATTVREIATKENVNEHEITRVLHLAFLSPKIVDDIFNGRQDEGVTVHRLRRLSSIPYDWCEQANLLKNLA
ncbi:MAG: hypothetical protein HOE65_13505, partial [Rhodospirillales bacterium]|nr:hypothetical protein [Rhodospirillales bacterium]